MDENKSLPRIHADIRGSETQPATDADKLEEELKSGREFKKKYDEVFKALAKI
jgi:hypothetical protein